MKEGCKKKKGSREEKAGCQTTDEQMREKNSLVYYFVSFRHTTK